MLGLLEMLHHKLRETLISLGLNVITKYMKSLGCSKRVINLDSLYYTSLEITPEASNIEDYSCYSGSRDIELCCA